MAKQLSQTITNQLDTKNIKPIFIFKINSVDYSSYLTGHNISYDINFGSASATFTLNNNSGVFGEGGSLKIEVGDVVELIEKFEGDSTEFKKFYGLVSQRSIVKSAASRVITLTCLDYISSLQYLDIDLEVEGTKVQVENETLTPNFLPAPNDYLAQVFNFANDSIADNPPPIIRIWDETHSTEDVQPDGFQILYQTGQLKLGSPINARDNYSIKADYWYYSSGCYIEDILEEILIQPTGYSKFIFNEESAEAVVNNHLTTDFYTEEGTNIDYLSPNYSASTITIKHQLASDVSEGATSITLTSTDGLPSSGQAEINGDIFTWSSISGNTLEGIPSSGEYSLKSHKAGDYVKYEATYEAGRCWYLSYSNLISDLTSDDFTIPDGASISYIDKRFGRIILDKAISTSSIVKCNTNYSFKTLQSSGIELNKITFKPRELENRFEAVRKLLKFCPPNYMIRTQGDNKIWATYLSQKVNYDYELKLVRELNYLEDEDLYTRVVLYGKNKNPTNITLGNEAIDFISGGQSYKGFATQTELSYLREEGNYYVFGTTISGAGYIDLENVKPIVYLNNIPIDDQLHQMVMQSVKIQVKTRTTTRTGCHGISSEQYTKTHTYYYYKVLFSHTNIEPSQPIYLYDQTGTLIKTISPYDNRMDYARGIYSLPGDEQNSVYESISTATYWVFYSTGSLIIDYDNVEFKIAKSLIPNLDAVLVTATFEYWTVMIPIEDIASVIDGRWNTQVQVEFYTEPPSEYPLTILDLGAIYNIQAMDIVAGFYKPDDYRKFDIDFNFTLQYSLDGVNFYNISDATYNVNLTGGQSVSFEEEDLGKDFQARYFKILLNKVKKIDYGDGVWVVAFSEFTIYKDIVIKSEATLIPTTTLTQDVNPGDTVIYVNSTEYFTEPESGQTATAYLDKDQNKAFTYTGLTSNSFTGCTVESGVSALAGDYVTQSIESDTTLYDDNNLLNKLGDRLYKDIRISDDMLFEKTRLDTLAKDYLKEFVKNHSKVRVTVLYAPFLKVGQTVRLVDTYNDVSTNYFIESINYSGIDYQLTLARFP